MTHFSFLYHHEEAHYHSFDSLVILVTVAMILMAMSTMDHGFGFGRPPNVPWRSCQLVTVNSVISIVALFGGVLQLLSPMPGTLMSVNTKPQFWSNCGFVIQFCGSAQGRWSARCINIFDQRLTSQHWCRIIPTTGDVNTLPQNYQHISSTYWWKLYWHVINQRIGTYTNCHKNTNIFVSPTNVSTVQQYVAQTCWLIAYQYQT